MSSEPKDIAEVHELMKRLMAKKKVSDEEAHYYLKRAIENKSNEGVWIKKENNACRTNNKFSVSIVEVRNNEGLIGFRFATKD